MLWQSPLKRVNIARNWSVIFILMAPKNYVIFLEIEMMKSFRIWPDIVLKELYSKASFTSSKLTKWAGHCRELDSLDYLNFWLTLVDWDEMFLRMENSKIMKATSFHVGFKVIVMVRGRSCGEDWQGKSCRQMSANSLK